jgi:hypothetical protein
MKRVKRDDHREERIDMEILVDAYTEEERAMGWYYYLADTVTFLFRQHVFRITINLRWKNMKW